MPNAVILKQQTSSKRQELCARFNLTNDKSRSSMSSLAATAMKAAEATTTTSSHLLAQSMKRSKTKMCASRVLVLFGSSLVMFVVCVLVLRHQVASSSSVEFNSQHQLEQHEHQSASFADAFGSSSGGQSSSSRQVAQVQASSSSFEPANYKSIQEAIRAHPDLREFAVLCQEPGVKEIISMDKTPLTVFAPIDRSLVDLLDKSSARQINLIELAKHHIAQGLIMADENTKFPLQFSTYTSMSPLYLNQLTSSSSGASGLFVNNARILATHLIPIDAGDNYQTLHIIDEPLEFAYMKQQRSPLSSIGSASSSSTHQHQSSLLSKRTTVKSAFNLDQLASQPESALEFYDRFGDIHASQPTVDVFHARAYTGSQQQQQQRISLSRTDLQSIDKLIQVAREKAPQLRGKLFQVNESSLFNTFFLPINSDELDVMLNQLNPTQLASALEAHIIPDQVLFTRTMGPLGHAHQTMNNLRPAASGVRVALNLAKTMPTTTATNSDQMSSSSSSSSSDSELSRKYLATPLLLQAQCSAATSDPTATHFQVGITSAEIVVANIPLTNGVLHLIKKPILFTELNVLDYLNDNDNQLSSVVNAVGSSTTNNNNNNKVLKPTPVKVNRFRELLARERQMLHTFSVEPNMNKTILAPSDEAFARLRFDLRALVQGDESLIPKHWDTSYRHDLLERLVKRHIVLHQTLTSEQIVQLAQAPQQQVVLSDNGKMLSFSSTTNNKLHVESDGTRARFLHHDLIGTNGVLHIIDRVFGEEQETVHSLLQSNVLKFNHSLWEQKTSSANENELNELIQTNLKAAKSEQQQQQPTATMISNSVNSQANEANSNQSDDNKHEKSVELATISKSIGVYLDQLSATNRRQLQLLGSSVNISYQLARLTSLAEGSDDWNEKFKSTRGQFTYFVPSDLAWIKLQQAQPELYKPLMHFLENNNNQQHQQQEEQNLSGDSADPNVVHQAAAAASVNSPRFSSESSHRLRQILERHLVLNRKISKHELNQLDSIQTSGATLRLIDAHQHQQQQEQPVTALEQQTPNANMFAAAFHSILPSSSTGNTQQQHNQQQQDQQLRLKSLSLESSSANIVQANEASNGWLYVIDGVLLLPNDAEHIVMTSAAPAISSTMSSLLGAHNSAIFDFIHNLFAPAQINMTTSSVFTLIGTLTVAIALLLLVALLLIARRRRQNKLHRHQQLESGLTSSSSANSGSTSTTKSL